MIKPILWALAFSLSLGHVNAAEPVRLPQNALRVPLVRQATDYSCGAAALLSTLYYWQAYDDSETSLFERLQTTEANGTNPRKIVEVAQALGLSANLYERMTMPDLELYLSTGATVIVDIQAWPDPPAPNRDLATWLEDFDNGHYVVLAGLDAQNAYFMDPSLAARYGYLPKNEFLARWHDSDIVDGKLVRTQQLGIVIYGKTPIMYLPEQAAKIE